MSNINIPYIDTLPNLLVNINKLVNEFNIIKDKMKEVVNHGNQVLVQQKYHLMLENKYDTLADKFIYTREIADQIQKTLSFNSINYRLIMPNTCYNWHVDTGQYCAHIPLITNAGCKFVYETRAFSMPANGSVYLVNNGKMHTFINAGESPRLHLTFETL